MDLNLNIHISTHVTISLTYFVIVTHGTWRKYKICTRLIYQFETFRLFNRTIKNVYVITVVDVCARSKRATYKNYDSDCSNQVPSNFQNHKMSNYDFTITNFYYLCRNNCFYLLHSYAFHYRNCWYLQKNHWVHWVWTLITQPEQWTKGIWDSLQFCMKLVCLSLLYHTFQLQFSYLIKKYRRRNTSNTVTI